MEQFSILGNAPIAFSLEEDEKIDTILISVC